MSQLIPSNGYKEGAPSAYLLKTWARIINDNVGEGCTSDDVESAADMAYDATGFRCAALQYLFWPGSVIAQSCMHKGYAALLLSTAAKWHDDDNKVRECEIELNKIAPGLGSLIIFCRVPAGTTGWDYYDYLVTYPAVSIVADKPSDDTRLTKADALELCKTESQRAALKRLLAIADAAFYYPSLGGIEIPRASLIVAPSGTGKTWLVQTAAKVLGMPLIESTVSGWSPRDALSNHNTMQKMITKLEAAPNGAIIFIDEICKIRSNESTSSGNYWRAVQTEIMQFVTRDVVDYTLSDRARVALNCSFFVFAGAFQTLYRNALPDNDVTAEDVEAVAITQEDLIESQYLPDELLNRTGAFIAISPPTRSEVSAAMLNVEIAAGLSIHEKLRSQAAEDIVARMQGFRGLQNYAIRVAVQAAQARRKKIPPSPGDTNQHTGF